MRRPIGAARPELGDAIPHAAVQSHRLAYEQRLHRARIDNYIQTVEYFEAEATALVEPQTDPVEIEALARSAQTEFESYVKLNKKVSAEVVTAVGQIENHSKLADTTLPSEIQGEAGSIVIDKISTPGQVRIVYRDGSVETIHKEQNPELIYYEVREFIDLIQNGSLESQINTHRLARDVMAVMDEARSQFGLVFPADSQ